MSAVVPVRVTQALLLLALASSLAGCGRSPKLLAQARVQGASEVRWVADDTGLAVALLGRGVLLLDPATGRERAARRGPSPPAHVVHGLATSARGETLAVATADSVRVFAARGLVPLLATPGEARAVALSDDGTTLAWTDGTLGRVVDVGTGAIFSQGTWPIGRDALAWGPLLRSFAVPIATTVRLVRGDSLSEAGLGPFEDGPPSRLAFSASGATLAVLEQAGHISFWDVQHDRLRWRLQLADRVRAEDFAISGDTWYLATSRGGHARLLWAYRGGSLADWSPHGGAEVRDLAFSRDGRRLATVGADGRVRVWAVPRPRQERG
jgi:WD40 repeat protein